MIEIMKACQYLLNSPEGEPCLNYLDSRLTKESQEYWGFGYFPSSANISLLTNLVNKEALIEKGLLYTKEINDVQSPKSFDMPFFENHPLIMPYKDSYGNVIGLVGRSFLSENNRQKLGIPKYKNTSFNKSNYV